MSPPRGTQAARGDAPYSDGKQKHTLNALFPDRRHFGKTAINFSLCLTSQPASPPQTDLEDCALRVPARVIIRQWIGISNVRAAAKRHGLLFVRCNRVV
jgi:hypothetical protein